MAVVYPAANDNWSTVANWMSNGIPYGQLPQSGDIVCANGKTIVIDMDLAAYTFVSLTTVATAPAVAGGGFTCASAYTINADIKAGSTNCLTLSHTGGTFNVIGSSYGSTTISGSAGVSIAGIVNSASGNLTVIGNVSSGLFGGNYGYGIINSSSGQINVIGDVISEGIGAYRTGIYNASTGQINVTGNVTGGSGYQDYGINCTAACTVTITGNVTGGGGSYAYGINCTAACTVTITGNVTGGSGSNVAYGILCTAACTVTITGNVTGGSVGYGINCTALSYVTIRGIITTQTPPIAQYQALNGTIVLYFAGIIISKTGMMPFNVQQFILLSSGSTMWTVKTELNTDKSIYTADYAPLGNPAITDVRDTISFGPVGELTGTLAVPPPAAVLLGVPTDNVVGTLAPASASDVWDHLLTGISVAGSIGKLIKDNLDVVVSSRSVLTAQQVWDVLLTSLVTPGSIGKLLVDDIDTKLSDLPTLFWSKVIDGTYTADKVLKIMASILAGKTVIVDTGNNTAIVTFRNLDDTGDVVKANMNNSERITMTLTP